MNEDELAQIEQRYVAADKVAPMSKWDMVDTECNCDCGHVRFDDDDNDIEIDCESGECAECLKELKANQSGLLTQTDGEYWYFHPRTLMFILGCRQDIPALIAEVRRLQGERDQMEAEVAGMREVCSEILKRLQVAEAVCEAAYSGVHSGNGAAFVRLIDAWREAKGE